MFFVKFFVDIVTKMLDTKCRKNNKWHDENESVIKINARKMIYITQLIYIKEGQEKTFHEFEDVAIQIIAKYKGRLLLRVRPQKDAFIQNSIDKPYEIHLVEFDSEHDFKNFMLDEERKKFLHLKEQSIESSVLYKGERL